MQENEECSKAAQRSDPSSRLPLSIFQQGLREDVGLAWCVAFYHPDFYLTIATYYRGIMACYKASGLVRCWNDRAEGWTRGCVADPHGLLMDSAHREHFDGCGSNDNT